MAFSKSVEQGQIAINCELCEHVETGGKISSKCLDCDLLLCNQCRNNVHPKFKNAGDHTIIDIKDVGKEVLDFMNIKCKEHARQYCCLFCQTCNKVVCPSCVTKVHKKHDLEEISEAYDQKVKAMKIKQSQFQKEQTVMNEKKIKLIQFKNDKTLKYNKVDQEILNHGETLKHAVDLFVTKIRRELQENQDSVLQTINFEIDTIEKASEQCNENSRKTDDLIHTTDVTKFFESVTEIEKLNDQSLVPNIKITFQSLPIFIPGVITQYNVGELNSDGELLDAEITVINEFQTELPVVHKVCPCPDDSLWICHNPSSTLQKVNPRGNSLQILSCHNIRVYCMSLTLNDDLLLATGEAHLKQIKYSTGAIQDTIYKIHSFISTSVHVSKDFKVMVGGVRQGRGAAVVMNQAGEQLTEYQQDKQNRPLFSYLRIITSTSNNSIYVADYRISDGHGRLVILDQTGDLQYYTGHKEVNRTKLFKPVDLTTTPNDNVIVVDCDTNTFHIFNISGQLATFYNTLDIGIRPASLGYSPSGQLCIGGTRPQGSTDKSKLYQVNLSIR